VDYLCTECSAQTIPSGFHASLSSGDSKLFKVPSLFTDAFVCIDHKIMLNFLSSSSCELGRFDKNFSIFDIIMSEVSGYNVQSRFVCYDIYMKCLLQCLLYCVSLAYQVLRLEPVSPILLDRWQANSDHILKLQIKLKARRLYDQ